MADGARHAVSEHQDQSGRLLFAEFLCVLGGRSLRRPLRIVAFFGLMALILLLA